MAVHESEIKFNVSLDENRVPENIVWSASDGGVSEAEAKAIMLAVWDEKSKSTLRIDLWSKEMSVDEMKQFFHQTILTMSDTLIKSTNEEAMAGDMRDFAQYFAEKMGLLNK
ncbi:MAG: gliding motility-associated protein GldC [Flavobacteriales bacterium]|jgi:gliding motility-associated protein GldC